MTNVSLDFTQILGFQSAREVYGKKLVELGAERKDIVVLTADLLASNKLGEFQMAFPDRFFNVGVAEANMMGIAAGLALEGWVPFVSTFATFASMRACEQVRTDIAYVNLPVKIIATMSGVSGGAAGPTHSGIEDMGIMRGMPNMTVIAPSDPLQMTQFVEEALEVPGPVYIRLGRGDDPVIYHDQKIEIGKAIVAREGSDVTIVACGTVMRDALEARQQLENDGVSVRVLDVHTVKPIDTEAVVAAAKETGHVVTVEDHLTTGGLGSAVAEVLAESGTSCRFKRLGIPDTFPIIGEPHELFHYYGYDAEGISDTVKQILK
jgi:transketolase